MRERERERERECMSGEQGKGKRESQAGSMLSAEPNLGLNPTTLGSLLEPKSRIEHSTDWASKAPPY